MISRSLAPVILLSLGLLGGCSTTSVPPPIVSSSPVVVPTPTPVPTPTYGPNQTAALAVVTKYYEWINTYSKDPSLPNFGEIQRLSKGEAQTTAIATVNNLATQGWHQEGDLVLAQASPVSDSASQIEIALCVDATRVTVVDKTGATHRPIDGLTRRAYTATVRNDAGTWVVAADRGGSTAC